MKKHPLPWLVMGLTALAILGVGCDTTFTEPEIEIIDLVNWELSGSSIKVEVELAVTNPNGFSATITRTTYRLWLNDIEVGEGYYEDLSLPSGRTVTVHLPLTMGFGPLFQAALAGAWPNVSYSLRGEANVRALVGTRDVEFRHSGTEKIPLDLDLLRFFP